MKIGIITFHRALNYGAILQSWALQEALERLGHEVEVLDYNSEQMKEYTSAVKMYGKKKNLKNYLSALAYAPYRQIRINRFKQFCDKWIKTTKPLTKRELEQICDDYDVFITGSDQVWSDCLTGFDDAYFLSFINDSRKKFSYAASFGFKTVPQNLAEVYKERLSTFHLISVREQDGAEIISELMGKEAVVCVDPTLLLPVDRWKKMVVNTESKEKYILIYSLNPVVELMNTAFQIAEKEDLKIYYISLEMKNLRDYSEIKRVKHIPVPNPQEFISYIYNAQMVLTNSFHGTVFSIIFHKRFLVETVYGEKQNNRIQELLKITGLEDRDILLGRNLPREESWENVDRRIEEKRGEAYQYIEQICSSAQGRS